MTDVPTNDFIRPAEDGIYIDVHVVPGAKSTGAVKYDVWRKRLEIRLAAPAKDAKANKELLRYISSILNVPQSALNISQGERSHSKSVHVKNTTTEYIMTKLEYLI